MSEVHCKHCGARVDCGKPDCDGSDQPSCTHPTEHCGKCPPWICDDCHEMDSMTAPCGCWTSFEGMNLADIKGVLALGDFDTKITDGGGA